MNSYHNTNELHGPALAKAEGKARPQEEIILAYFRECYKAGPTNRTPWEVCSYFNDRYPITSIRRAITNLTNAGMLKKADIQRRGRYAAKESAWVYVPQKVSGEQMKMF